GNLEWGVVRQRSASLLQGRGAPARRRAPSPTPPRRIAASQGMPRQEGKSAFLTLSKHILRRAVGEIVTVLHRDDRRDALRPAQFIDADVGEADVPDLALALQFGERAHRLVKRHLRIGRMQLIDIDTLQLQPSQACLAGGAQMLRSAVVFPGLTPRSPEPAFGRDEQAFRIRVERFGNEPLVDLRTVGVGGIDEGDAELDSTHQHALSTRTIKRFTPYTRAAQAHGAEPEAIHGRVATEGEAATRTIRPQPVRILSGHFAFLFRADSAHIEAYATSMQHAE